jgi:RHS repeat-associated protein
VEYGNTADSKIKYGTSNYISNWLINKVTDPNGNYYTYHYNTYNGENYLEKIKFTGNTAQNVLPFNEVHFFYTTRSDNNFYYDETYKTETSLLLTEIKVFNNNNLFRKYELKYILNDYSLLYSIIESNGNGEKYNPTIFKYGGRNIDSPKSIQTVEIKNTQQSDNGNKIFGDFDGDGILDLCNVNSDNNDFSAYKSNYLSRNLNEHENTLIQKKITTPTGGRETHLTTSGDFNGDGKSDIIYTSKHIQGSITKYWFIYYKSEGNGFIEISRFSLEKNEVNLVLASDFIGTGVDQLLIRYKVGNNWKIQLFSLYNTVSNQLGTQFISTSQDLINNECNNGIEGELMIINSDNDSKADLLHIHDRGDVLNQENESYIYTFFKNHTYEIKKVENLVDKVWELKTGDFNGDGLTDLLYFKKDNGDDWKIRYGIEYNFTAEYNAPNFIYPNADPKSDFYTNNFFIGDYNGDGKSDIVEYYFNNNIFNYDVFYSIGYNNFYKESNIVNNSIYRNEQINVVSADFSSDGNDDLYIWWSNGTDRVITFHAEEEKYHLRKLLNGLNNKIEINFKPLIHNNNYQPGNSSSFPLCDITGTSFVVTTTTESNNGTYVSTNPDTYKTNYYYYYEAIYHRQGLGLLGFKKNKIWSENIITENYFDIDNSNYNLRQIKSKIFKNNTTSINQISEVDYINSNIDLSNIFILYHKRFLPVVTKITEHNIINNTFVYKNNTFDASGNITNSITKYGSETVPVKSEEQIFEYSNINCWVDNILTKKTTKLKHEDDPNFYNRSVNYSFDNKLRLTSQTSDLSTPFEVKEDYTYNNFGLVLTKTISATYDPSVSSKTTQNTYSTNGRYLEQVTDNSGNVVNYTYNTTLDRLLTESSYNLTTTYTFNNWGETIQTNYANGEVSNNYREWTQFPNSQNSLFRVRSTSNNDNEVKVYYDIWGNEIRSESILFNSQTSIVEKVANKFGIVSKESMPYFAGDFVKWKEFNYDLYGRLVTTTGKVSTNPSEDLVTSINYSGLSVTTTDAFGNTKTTTVDLSGAKTSITDNGGTLEYKYYSSGAIKEVKQGSNSTLFEYDLHGNKTKMTDPNAGISEYTYNKFNQLKTQKDAKNNLHTFNYDVKGKLINKVTPSGTISYTYYNTGNNKNLPFEVISPAGKKSIYYNNNRQIIKEEDLIDGQLLSTLTNYDTKGNISELTYPSGFGVKYIYNNEGYLTHIRRKDNDNLIWSIGDVNENNIVENYSYGNGITTSKTFNNYGYMVNINAKFNNNFVQNMNYTFDPKKNVMLSRTDVKNIQTETFNYDNLYRLTGYNINNSLTKTISYQNNGNIATKSDIGTYKYDDPTHINALTEIENPSGFDGCFAEELTFDSFDNVKTVDEGAYHYEITYLDESIRKKTLLKENGLLKYTKYYANDYEKIIDNITGKITEIHYISFESKYIASYIKETDGVNTTNNLYYFHTDHLGSIQVITKEDATILSEFSYDAWGKLRKHNDWTFNYNIELDDQNFQLLQRGFTGHEHLSAFGLINMNGRMYDPCLGRFLQVDNFAQDPTSTQGLNRYSYILNNPLLTSDPSGEIAPFLVAIAYGALMGATISSVTYTLTAGLNFTWKGLGNATAMGAIGGALGGGMGALGGGLGTFGNSFGYNMISNIASTSMTSAIYGSKLTWGTVVGSVAGAALGGAMGNSFGKYSSSTLINGAKDILASSIKGMFTGYVNGFAQAAIDGNTNAPLQGMIGGAVGGFSSSLILNAAYGTPIEIENCEVQNVIENYDIKELKEVLNNTLNKPIFRSGDGFIRYIIPETLGQVFGTNIYLKAGNKATASTIFHELIHLYQQNRDGWATMMGGAIYEQSREYFTGWDAYKNGIYESQASWYEGLFKALNK